MIPSNGAVTFFAIGGLPLNTEGELPVRVLSVVMILSLVADGKLYVIYSNCGGRGGNQNSAELAIIPLGSLQSE